jgi:transcriptional repressor NrdR
MKCPFCSHLEDRVIDSRLSKDGDVIRRRRECLKCEGRFTSYERIEEVLPLVIKKDGRREPFDRKKILHGLEKACEKRPIGIEPREALVSRIEKKLQESGEKEVPSSRIGEEVMAELKAIDEVAYVRFASVYRQFKDVKEFMKEIEELVYSKYNKNNKDKKEKRNSKKKLI